MKQIKTYLIATCIFALSSTAQADHINIDFGHQPDQQVKQGQYWNFINDTGTHELKNYRGEPTGITISLLGGWRVSEKGAFAYGGGAPIQIEGLPNENMHFKVYVNPLYDEPYQVQTPKQSFTFDSGIEEYKFKEEIEEGLMMLSHAGGYIDHLLIGYSQRKIKVIKVQKQEKQMSRFKEERLKEINKRRHRTLTEKGKYHD